MYWQLATLRSRINLGLVLSQKGDPAGAVNVYRGILKQKPAMAEIHNNLGLALMQMKDPKAETTFKEAIRLKPDYAEAHYKLGLALLQTGKKEESDSEFEKAYELAPYLKTRAAEAPQRSEVSPKN
jgi:Flp pilus assembly protein TadD